MVKTSLPSGGHGVVSAQWPQRLVPKSHSSPSLTRWIEQESEALLMLPHMLTETESSRAMSRDTQKNSGCRSKPSTHRAPPCLDFLLGKIALMFAQLFGESAVKETMGCLLTGSEYSQNPQGNCF